MSDQFHPKFELTKIVNEGVERIVLRKQAYDRVIWLIVGIHYISRYIKCIENRARRTFGFSPVYVWGRENLKDWRRTKCENPQNFLPLTS